MIKEAIHRWKIEKEMATSKSMKNKNLSLKEITNSYLKMSLLRFCVVGSVDDGKSTLIGRLLYDTKSILIDQLKSVKNASIIKGNKEINLAFFTDGLKLEREKGITIDVAYRYFYTPFRKFIIADTPGHFEFTRNMVTGSSLCNLVIILIDATKGITEQTRRHAFIASLMQIPHLVVCINKIDLVNYDKKIYYDIVEQFMTFSSKLNISDIHFIPISAKYGDNVVKRSKNTKWYDGPTLLWLLNNIYIRSDYNYIDARFAVQFTISNKLTLNSSYGIAGKVLSGVFRNNDKIITLPKNEKARIIAIHSANKELNETFYYENVILYVDVPLNVSCGDIIVKENNLPEVNDKISAMFCWLSEVPSNNQEYLLIHISKKVECKITDILYKIDVNTLKRYNNDNVITINEIGRFNLQLNESIYYDSFRKNKHTGSFILVCPFTHETVAAGMIV
ncbi:MAG: GTP-binding protein [Bacteroidales bacterium]|nr:GTP-binding protein [Bacteroidales bacterium]